MDLMRWMGVTFARFVALVMVILGGWTFGANIAALRYETWVLAWILASGLTGFLGGIAYLISFDGPVRFRSQKIRFGGWVGMLVSAFLPTSLTLMILPMVILVAPIWPYARVQHETKAESGLNPGDVSDG